MDASVCNYWRKELGSEFRKTALQYVGGYVEKAGKVEIDQDNKTYTAVLDINDVLSTIIPVNIACESSVRVVRFVSKIKVDGTIHRTKFKDVTRKQVEHVTFYDNQNVEIEAMTICIDCLLVLLDTLDQLINGEYRDDFHIEKSDD
jgi:hypothetical protein